MIDELNILAALLPQLPASPDVPVGPGDDCAAIATGGGDWLLAAVDQVIGDVHYDRATTAPEAAGAKLLKRNLSDIAAMGGVPKWALLAAAGAADAGAGPRLLAFCRGAAACAAEFGVNLCGGDLAAMPRGVATEAASLTILGTVPAAEIVRRSGARPGDWLLVTGELGNSYASGHHLTFRPRLAEGRLLARRRWASAMLDLSDGLLLDAARLARASGVALTIDPGALPLRAGASTENALADGEDYELLFTVPDAKLADLLAEWPADWTRPTRIGRAEAAEGPLLRTPEGEDLLGNRRGGYEH